jgi:hypothetical protein
MKALRLLSSAAGIPLLAVLAAFSPSFAFDLSGAFSTLQAESSGTQIQSFSDSGTTRYQQVYVGSGIDATAYRALYPGSSIPVVRSIGSYTPGDIYTQTGGYRFASLAIQTPGLYKLSVVQGVGDPISAIYAANGSALPYNPADPTENLYVFNDDSQGVTASGPWDVYFNKTDSACLLIQFIIYQFGGGDPSGLTGSFRMEGPGSIGVSCYSGPLANETLRALGANRDAVRAILSLRGAALAAMMDYDCTISREKRYCVTFQARYGTQGDIDTGGGLLAFGYRVTQHLRIGAFIDLRVAENDPTGINSGTERPTLGAYVTFSQNENGAGLQAKVAGAYGSGRMTVTRALFGAGGDTEAGSGTAGVYGFAIGAEIGWGVVLSSNLIATPYLGLRYTETARKAYSERYISGDVEFPISYGDFYQRTTNGVLALKLKGMLTDHIEYRLAAGLEYELARDASPYRGTSTIVGLETFSLEHGGPRKRSRAFGTAALHYQIDANQRLLGSISLRETPFSTSAALTTLVGYQLGF